MKGDNTDALVRIFDKFVKGVGNLVTGMAARKERGVNTEEMGDPVFESGSLGSGDEFKEAHEERVD